jgi:hypothetical protein
LLTIIVINEELKEAIVRNGLQAPSLENTIYVYFPFDARVDETFYVMGIAIAEKRQQRL